MDGQSKYLSPRMQGIYEQYKRAKRFVRLAHRCKTPVSRFRNLIAAVYPARAIVELMVEAAKKQELVLFQDEDVDVSVKRFKENVAPQLPYYNLLYKIRIHDFHRFGCLPPSQEYKAEFIGGPIKLKASKGSASLSLMPEGPEFTATGNSSIEEDRPLFIRSGLFFDEESRQYVSLSKILSDFLKAVPNVIEYFMDCCRRAESAD